MQTAVRVLLISGSLRAGSTSGAAFQTLPEVVDPGTAAFRRYFGTAALPHFNPDDDFDPVHKAVAELRALIDDADALLFSTPEYAGDLPGSFKNLLDWTVGGNEIGDKPTGWINPAQPGRSESTYAALRTVLGYTGADIVEDACVRVPVARAAIDTETGVITDPAARHALADAVGALVAYVRTTRDATTDPHRHDRPW